MFITDMMSFLFQSGQNHFKNLVPEWGQGSLVCTALQYPSVSCGTGIGCYQYHPQCPGVWLGKIQWAAGVGNSLPLALGIGSGVGEGTGSAGEVLEVVHVDW